MKTWKYALSALATAALLAGCGGGGGATSSNSIGFTSIVSFGDSLSDAGTYAVGSAAALKGGRYTINSGDLAKPSKIWLDHIAAQYSLPAPCAAETGLNSRAPFGAPVASVKAATCRDYAMGGSRVTQAVGPAHTVLPDAAGGAIGQFDTPIVTQIANHLGVVGSFSGKELVTVLAGGNDIFMNGAAVNAAAGGGVGAAGAATIAGWTADQIAAVAAGGAAAQGAAAQAAVIAMGTAGAQLAGYVKANIVGKGAKYVLVMNLGDLASTPYGIENPAAVPLVAAMTKAFNDQLTSGLAGVAGVVVGDVNTVTKDQFANPAAYGISNIKNRACDTSLAKNPLGGASFVCNPLNVIAGDVSRYQFADDVHPTPYGHQLLAQFAAKVLATAGWL